MDPVVGGNDSAYLYPADPVNGMDLDGMRKKQRKKCFTTTNSFSQNGSVFDVDAHWCSRRGKILGKPQVRVSQRVKSGASIFVKTDGLGPAINYRTTDRRTWVHKQSANYKVCEPLKAVCTSTFYIRVEGYFHANGTYAIKYDDSRVNSGPAVWHRGRGDQA